eukprot:1955600-Amphidinium_carterae.1
MSARCLHQIGGSMRDKHVRTFATAFESPCIARHVPASTLAVEIRNLSWRVVYRGADALGLWGQ